MSRVILKFPDDETRDNFMSWFSDGGGEQLYFDISQIYDTPPMGHCDYAKAFPAWGWKPEDGDPVIVVSADPDL